MNLFIVSSKVYHLILFCRRKIFILLAHKTSYYCRDPDTGKLHPANSTWPSTTFCGNYSCKLRRKTLLGSQLIRKINVSNVNITKPIEARVQDTPNDAEFAGSNITPQVVKPTHAPNAVTDKILFYPEFNNGLNELQERLRQKVKFEGGDRFLTETEIKTISDLLHNVKKSDLEAIVDIYNLAQDIYKEMDKMTSENIMEETLRLAQNIKANQGEKQHSSYWYDPINRNQKTEIKADMEHQGSVPVPTTNPASYFSGPLTNTDFGKLPYYYPVSSFHRESSYIHPTYNPQQLPQPQLPPVHVKPPCSHKQPAPVAYTPPPPQYNYPPQQGYQSPQGYQLPQGYQPPQGYPPAQGYPPSQNYPQYYPNQYYGGVLKRPFTIEPQKMIQPSVLLPYPFSYIQHTNTSSYPFNLNYAENPWTGFDMSNKNSNPPKENKAPSLNNVISDTDKQEASKPLLDIEKILEGNLFENLLATAKIIKKPEWQTDPLPAKVLEEVKAHFEEKAKLLKPFSLRKKVKLERVGKVVKLDDLNRKRRSIDEEAKVEKIDDDDFEAYIEKTTCQSDISPGFFRMGNQSEPYPACCPQRIDNDSR
ncbi:hypothetical protein ABMA27_010027 [Loxostege sticticalis]|uniref:Uncharacterized protein n=1 Tax=Loxostege sticticalis TaxID=481309 RepID=A0ABR3H7A7_LOXSC